MLLSTINLFCCILFQCFAVDFLSSDFTLIFALFQFKLCKVRSVQFGQKGIPYLNTDPASVPSARDHNNIPHIKFNEISDLVAFKVQLDGVIGLD